MIETYKAVETTIATIVVDIVSRYVILVLVYNEWRVEGIWRAYTRAYELIRPNIIYLIPYKYNIYKIIPNRKKMSLR